MTELTERDAVTVAALANCGLNCKKAAESLGIHRNSMRERLNAIRDKTGVDPRSFWGLAKILSEIQKEANNGVSDQ